MTWSTPETLREQVRRLWRQGRLLASLVDGESPYPIRLRLKGPSPAEVSQYFDEARGWVASLREAEKSLSSGGYRLVWRDVRHRVLGTNSLPVEAWVDSLDDALALVGHRRDVERFRELLALTRERQPGLVDWLARHPMRVLALADDWQRLLEIVAYLRARPRPAIFLRQVDLSGVDSKFIESHRTVLADLLDRVLPATAIDASAVGLAAFDRRYGFLQKPARVRFRLLDPDVSLLPAGCDQDLTVTADAFARLDVPVERVFVTENEINFLSLPMVRRSLAIFGAGYGFENLAAATWLLARDLRYWGDIDTHGFAMLDQFRARFGHARSFLMDRETLLSHREQWGHEPRPAVRELSRLNDDERALYEDLRDDRLGERVRLEQERIGFGWVKQACRWGL